MSIPAIVARPTHRAIQHGAVRSCLLRNKIGFWPCNAVFGLVLARDVNCAASRARVGLPRPFDSSYSLKRRSFDEHIYVPRRPISYTSHLRRKWMERQQSVAAAQPHQQPIVVETKAYQQQQHFQLQARAPPTTWNRAMLTTYGLIGLFLAVWCAHNYSEGGTLLPNGIPLPKPPGWDAVTDLLGVQKSKPSIPRGLQTPSSVAFEIKTNFSSAALSYRTSDYPPPAWDVKHLSPFVASIFSHFEPLHLAFMSYGAWMIMPTVMVVTGIPRALAAYVLGGTITIVCQCEADRAYALNQAPWLFKHIKAAKRDPDPMGTLGTQHVGGTGALLALWSVRALAFKTRNFRVLTMVFIAFDMVGYYMDLDTGASYTTHLAGMSSGCLMWFGWLRWTKVVRRFPRL